MGVHYVLEGSALGARVLCKQVEALGNRRLTARVICGRKRRRSKAGAASSLLLSAAQR
jgi:heme oxygenase